ncbi:MGMT family protein [Candidatus Woesearchaeota archaeon]|nr:MGMT family protein [Candidatus Woesearchaeota archaeon]
MGFNEEVLRLAGKIPKGKVTTYKEIAKKLKTKAYRAVGNALNANKQPVIIPCHRVVKSDGSLGGYCGVMNSKKKKFLLEKEGIKVKGNKIADFSKKRFRFKK